MFSRIYGKGQAVIIIHGLFGMSDNWNSIGKKISDNFNVHIIDLRNHGRSFHNNNFSYHDMSNDLQEYLFQHNIQKKVGSKLNYSVKKLLSTGWQIKNDSLFEIDKTLYFCNEYFGDAP